MRIGIFDPYLDTLSGGERYMLTAAFCMPKTHEVDVFWDDTAILQKAKERFNLRLENVKVVRNVFGNKIPIWRKIIETRKYDRIFFLSDGSIPVSAAKKTILHFQSPISNVKKSILTQIKLTMISNIVCNSNYTKEYIDKIFGCNSQVIYPPVQMLKDTLQEKKNIILSVGRFSKLPGEEDFKKLSFMIDIFKKIQSKQLQDWQFIIVTNNLEKDKHEIDKLRMLIGQSPIHIEANISSDQLGKIYHSAKIYWHAAGYKEDQEKHPERVEHFGISTVEAMSAGCIPVVFNAGGQREIIQDGKNGYLWSDEAELLQKTLWVANNPTSINIDYGDLEKKFSEARFCKQITESLL